MYIIMYEHCECIQFEYMFTLHVYIHMYIHLLEVAKRLHVLENLPPRTVQTHTCSSCGVSLFLNFLIHAALSNFQQISYMAQTGMYERLQRSYMPVCAM